MNKIKAINTATNEEFIFNTINEASKKLNIYKGSISHVLNGKRKTAGGYVFERIDSATPSGSFLSQNSCTDDTTPTVIEKDGNFFVSSKNIAGVFGKKHKNVIRDIEELQNKLAATSGSTVSTNIIIKENTDITLSDKTDEYLLSRDAVTLLVMGYNTQRAFEFKLAYISQFNAMENAIKQLHANELLEANKKLFKLENKVDKLKNCDNLLTVKEIQRLVFEYANLACGGDKHQAYKEFYKELSEKIHIDIMQSVFEYNRIHNTHFRGSDYITNNGYLPQAYEAIQNLIYEYQFEF